MNSKDVTVEILNHLDPSAFKNARLVCVLWSVLLRPRMVFDGKKLRWVQDWNRFKGCRISVVDSPLLPSLFRRSGWRDLAWIGTLDIPMGQIPVRLSKLQRWRGLMDRVDWLRIGSYPTTAGACRSSDDVRLGRALDVLQPKRLIYNQPIHNLFHTFFDKIPVAESLRWIPKEFESDMPCSSLKTVPFVRCSQRAFFDEDAPTALYHAESLSVEGLDLKRSGWTMSRRVKHLHMKNTSKVKWEEELVLDISRSGVETLSMEWDRTAHPPEGGLTGGITIRGGSTLKRLRLTNNSVVTRVDLSKSIHLVELTVLNSIFIHYIRLG